jgi:hypothetical protein
VDTWAEEGRPLGAMTNDEVRMTKETRSLNDGQFLLRIRPEVCHASLVMLLGLFHVSSDSLRLTA